MKYKLNQNNNLSDIKEEILFRRGIEKPQEYLNANDSDIVSYNFFGDNLKVAYNILMNAIKNNYSVFTVVDPDFDGMCASSILYQYIKKTFDFEIGYFTHTSKQHGLTDEEMFSGIVNKVKNENLKLLFLPDSGTNDVESCKVLTDLGCNVVIFDHHEQEKVGSSAILINPQTVLGYPNLASSGCAVTWKFIKFVDDEEWVDNADEYLDLVALSTISDSMDIRTFENRQFLNLGLSSVKNKFVQEFINKDYRIKEVTPTNLAFYLVPAINGMVRVGSQEEKELVFRALCQIDEEFDYQKRDKTIVKESIYTRAVRLCTNAKSRQDRAIDKGIEIVKADIEANHRDKNKILFALTDDEKLDKAFSGLVAMKLAQEYNCPCVLLREGKNDYFSGSIRNFNNSPLTDLKSFLKSIGYVAWIQGHANAAGIGLTKKQLIKTIELSNEKLKDYDFSPISLIDFEFDYLDLSNLDDNFLLSLYDLRFYYGQKIDEVKILIKNININSNNISFFAARETSEKKNNWKFELKNGIDVIKFRADDNDYILDKFGKSDFNWSGVEFKTNMIFKIGRTEFNGEQRWCMLVEDYEIIED
jgi:single-stranded-DNA-specific exonuclease